MLREQRTFDCLFQVSLIVHEALRSLLSGQDRSSSKPGATLYRA